MVAWQGQGKQLGESEWLLHEATAGNARFRAIAILVELGCGRYTDTAGSSPAMALPLQPNPALPMPLVSNVGVDAPIAAVVSSYYYANWSRVPNHLRQPSATHRDAHDVHKLLYALRRPP